ncbi:MATE family efflux transporter [Listeria booriae]|uniref:Probable multidrug resistance protein NorM n=1 Tax=Listeria booriae TaxID=1552123 RepID=A0A842AYZ9_9LIST|nr:MATE family efflux transporter [Listeria booriae]MBC1795108.1 MATE family efflux transporter [Listeria booriae]
MEQTFTSGEKWRQFFVIFTPVVVSQLMLFSMALIDTMMSGHYSNEALAGTAIGNSLWGPFNASLSGLLMAVTPIISQLIGRGEGHDIKRTVSNGLYIAIGLAALLITLNFLFVPSILRIMGLDPTVASIARHFLNGICFGVPAFFFYSVLRAFIDSLGLTRVTMMITLITVPVNIFLNYLLIFGNWGFPELGGVGSGYATGITYWIVLLVTIILIQNQKRLRNYHIFSGFQRFSLEKMKEIIKLGVPNGLTILFEVSIFSAVTVFMGRFGTDTIAAHQSAISVPTLLYAFPLSIAAALTILVGFETGAKRLLDAKKYRHIGMVSAIAIGVVNGVLLLLFRDQIALLFTNDPKLADLITHFLIYAVLFQFADALLSPVLGALRGYKDVTVTSIVAFISYWIIGLPLGLLLSYTTLGPFGFWIGLSAGLFIAAFILSIRVRFTEKRLA